MFCQVERDEAVASAEKSEENCVTYDNGENRRAVMEQDRQQQRERISQWKVAFGSLTYFSVICIFIVCSSLQTQPVACVVIF